MGNVPFFSIIIPVYKVENYLKECIDSVLIQDFDNYEIILVDDGSPDSCPIICDDYAEHHVQIRVIHKENGGLSDARNVGVQQALGKYITFIDSDDFWRGENVLSTMYDIIKKNNCPDIILSDCIKFYDKTNRYKYPTLYCDELLNGSSKEIILSDLYYRQGDLKMTAWQKFVSKNILDNIKFKKGLLSEDIDWSFLVYSNAKTICLNSIPYYCYRQNRLGSITNTASKKSFDSLCFIIEKWKNLIPKLYSNLEERNIFLGYLAYQLSILMNLYNKLDYKDRGYALDKIKDNIGLFNQSLNFKTKKTGILIKLFGIKNTCRIINLFVFVREFISRKLKNI